MKGKINVSQYKCPFCNKPLRVPVFCWWGLMCDNEKCSAYNCLGNIDIWNKLITIQDTTLKQLKLLAVTEAKLAQKQVMIDEIKTVIKEQDWTEFDEELIEEGVER